LVHLDIKPENIFISLDHLTPSPHSPESKPSQEENKVIVSTTNPSNVAVAAEGTSNSTKNVDSTKVRSVVARGDISGNESTDSGHASGCDARFFVENSSASNTDGGVDGRISYKIGDLGHVAPIYGDHIPEEGDCRYMAPELLADDVDREKLPKADIFSLGLTLYEAASLQELPKNSLEDPMYERIKSGDLPFIEGYSKEFNQMLKVNFIIQRFLTKKT
jgi:serine/threonine protein kinase